MKILNDNNCIKYFLNNLTTVEGLSKNTLDSYRRDIDDLKYFLKKKIKIYLMYHWRI